MILTTYLQSIRQHFSLFAGEWCQPTRIFSTTQQHFSSVAYDQNQPVASVQTIHADPQLWHNPRVWIAFENPKEVKTIELVPEAMEEFRYWTAKSWNIFFTFGWTTSKGNNWFWSSNPPPKDDAAADDNVEVQTCWGGSRLVLSEEGKLHLLLAILIDRITTWLNLYYPELVIGNLLMYI